MFQKCEQTRKHFIKVTVVFLVKSISLKSFVHHQTAFLPGAHVRVSPLDLPDLLTQPGEVLSELHHHNDGSASGEHAGRPQQRVEDDAVVVEPHQEDGLLLLAGVVVTGHLRVHLQPLGDVHDHHMHGHAVLLAPGHVETLPANGGGGIRSHRGCAIRHQDIQERHFLVLLIVLKVSFIPQNIPPSFSLTKKENQQFHATNIV